jgi:hypothetical protein
MELEPEIPTSSDTTTTVEYEVIPLPEADAENPSKSGPKPKQLVAVEAYGYQMGRGLQRRIVNPDDVYKLAALGCNTLEIARWFDVNKDTLQYHFSDIIEKGREDLKHNLRRAMLKNAMSGNAALQIFLAKNYLGMSDNPTNAQDSAPLPWED